MLHRVVVDVIDMGAKIDFIDDASLPEAALPDAALSTLDLAGADNIFVWNAAGEC